MTYKTPPTESCVCRCQPHLYVPIFRLENCITFGEAMTNRISALHIYIFILYVNTLSNASHLTFVSSQWLCFLDNRHSLLLKLHRTFCVLGHFCTVRIKGYFVCTWILVYCHIKKINSALVDHGSLWTPSDC